MQTYVTQSVWIWVILPHLIGNCPSQSRKKVPQHLWNQVTPPAPFRKNVQTQLEKFLNKFGII